MGIRRALVALLVALVVVGIAASSLWAAPVQATDTPAPTATLAAGYQHQLSSGKTFTVWARMSFGDIFTSAILAALLLVVLIYIVYEVIQRWTIGSGA